MIFHKYYIYVPYPGDWFCYERLVQIEFCTIYDMCNIEMDVDFLYQNIDLKFPSTIELVSIANFVKLDRL